MASTVPYLYFSTIRLSNVFAWKLDDNALSAALSIARAIAHLASNICYLPVFPDLGVSARLISNDAFAEADGGSIADVKRESPWTIVSKGWIHSFHSRPERGMTTNRYSLFSSGSGSIIRPFFILRIPIRTIPVLPGWTIAATLQFTIAWVVSCAMGDG